MRTLDVFLLEEHVGQVVETRRGGRFQYDARLLERRQGTPLLSLSLPVKRRAFGESKTSNWFEGLLPEGPRRDAICRRLEIDPYDWIGLLGEIGWECAGAVQVFPEGRRDDAPAGYEELNRSELTLQLSDIAAREPLPGSSVHRMSLGGFQDKVCIAMPRLGAEASVSALEGAAMPIGDAASTHILKPESARYPGSAESEAWAMTAASAAAETARVALLELPDAPPTLVVERYDRMGSSWPDDITRVHQEDGCQALGLPPSHKYASEATPKGDDPSYLALSQLLVRYAENPEQELFKLLRHMVVTFCLGDWDAHAKNVSFLYRKTSMPTLAPLYDVMPIAEVEPRTQTLSLSVGGELDPREVTRGSILEEARSWGMEAGQAANVLDDTLSKLAQGADTASGQYPAAGKRHTENAKRRIDRLAG